MKDEKSIKIDGETYKAIKKINKKSGVPLFKIIQFAVEHYLKKNLML